MSLLSSLDGSQDVAGEPVVVPLRSRVLRDVRPHGTSESSEVGGVSLQELVEREAYDDPVTVVGGPHVVLGQGLDPINGQPTAFFHFFP